MRAETAEVSDDDNWVRRAIEDRGLHFLAFEGYTVVGETVTLVLDRRRVDDVRAYDATAVWREFRTDLEADRLRGKLRMADVLGCPYVLAIYDGANVDAYRLSSGSASRVERFDSYGAFGEWTMQFRDRTMTKRFDEWTDLPAFDRELRNRDAPWPGNLDSFWYDPASDDVRAVVEFNTTNTRYNTVAEHCNNDYFDSGRHDDRQRWAVVELVSEAVERPLIIVVWSPDTDEADVKIKRVEEIVYERGPDQGLHYSRVELLEDVRAPDARGRIVETLEAITRP